MITINLQKLSNRRVDVLYLNMDQAERLQSSQPRNRKSPSRPRRSPASLRSTPADLLAMSPLQPPIRQRNRRAGPTPTPTATQRVASHLPSPPLVYRRPEIQPPHPPEPQAWYDASAAYGYMYLV